MTYYNGNGQNNSFTGGSGADILNGNNGNDILNGGDGNDVIDGGNNDDILSGGNGADNLLGGSGSDTLEGGAGNDILDGGAAIDTVSFANAVNNIWVELNQGAAAGFARDGNMSGLMGTDTLYNLENVVGSNYNDIIKGNAANNVLRGGGGYDTLYASLGVDTIDGGAGGDSADFSGIAGFGATVNLATGSYSLNANNYGTLISIDDATGTAQADSLTGSSVRNVLDGGAGNDFMAGGGGDDIMWGGAGSDRLIADGGNDTLTGNYSIQGYGDNASDVFEIRTNAGNVTISDFKAGIDKLDLTAFGVGSSAWSGSAAQAGANTVMSLTNGTQTVTLTLQGVSQGYMLQASDFIGGSASLIPAAPPPANGGNGVADVFVVDPQLGNQVFDHFENGLDKLNIHFLQVQPGYWHGGLAQAPGTTDAQLYFHGQGGEHFTVSLPGMPYYNIDASDYIL